MEKLAYFFIDDVIWVLRDLARRRPDSIYDNDFMRMLKRAHDDNGMTVQLNLFYRTDFFYGDDEFTLAEMPDIYKEEFSEAKDWLRFAFHAKQEFPDYPYVNATYDDVKANYEDIINEVKRFAGEGSVAKAIVPHWLPISKEGCKALADCGAKFLAPSVGETQEFTGDESVLPYGHAARLKQNRQPETKLFTRPTKDERIRSSICAYNHISQEDFEGIQGINASILDTETGIRFRQIGRTVCLNTHTYEEVERELPKFFDREFVGYGVHEQYFYKDYYAYQEDYEDKLYLASKLIHDAGYRFVTADEFK